MSFQYSVQSGIGTDGKPWTRTPSKGWTTNPFHPEDEHRTTEEILQDCRELDADCARLEREIAVAAKAGAV